MKQVSLRQFSLQPSKYLKELPIVLTRYNLPVAIVTAHKNDVSTGYVYKSKHGDIPVVVRDDIPPGKLYITNNDKGITEFDINTLESKQIVDPTQPLDTSVKKATCPICHLSVPAEQSNQHYQKEHGDI